MCNFLPSWVLNFNNISSSQVWDPKHSFLDGAGVQIMLPANHRFAKNIFD